MEMGFRFNLSPDAQLILRIISESKQKEIPQEKLNKAFHFFHPLDAGLSSAINAYTENFPAAATPSEKKLIEKELLGLEYVGLVTLSEIVKKKKISSTYSSTGEVKTRSYNITLTEEGKRIADAIINNRRLNFRPRKSAQTSVFIACAFGKPEIDELCDIHFIPAGAKLGYRPVRVDRSEPERTITELIMHEIEKAAAIIADLTYARPSVYFEIGYAIGLGIPIILTCRDDHMNGTQDNLRVHFDLAQYKISFWKLNENHKYQWSNETLNPAKRLADLLLPKE